MKKFIYTRITRMNTPLHPIVKGISFSYLQ